MPNRSERRAAQRQAQKLAVKASKVMLAEQAPTDATQSRGTTCTGRPETMTASVGGSDQPPPPDTFNFQDLVDEIKPRTPAAMPTAPTRSTAPARAPRKAKPNLP